MPQSRYNPWQSSELALLRTPSSEETVHIRRSSPIGVNDLLRREVNDPKIALKVSTSLVSSFEWKKNRKLNHQQFDDHHVNHRDEHPFGGQFNISLTMFTLDFKYPI